jgi:hypothetical protein
MNISAKIASNGSVVSQKNNLKIFFPWGSMLKLCRQVATILDF